MRDELLIGLFADLDRLNDQKNTFYYGATIQFLDICTLFNHCSVFGPILPMPYMPQ
jgi:hypothetical protein